MELSKSKFSIYSSLSSAKMRRKHGLFAVEGEKSVEDTLSSFTLEALICESGHVPGYASGRNVLEVSSDTMRRLSSLTTPPHVMAIYRLPAAEEPADLRVKERLYMVLDGVQDPGQPRHDREDLPLVRHQHDFRLTKYRGHLQSEMRAVHYGIDSEGTGRLLRPETPVRRQSGHAVYGTLLEGDDIFSAELGDKGFIMMGNEGNGISPALRAEITAPLYIPPANADHGESLNVAIAAAVTLSQFAAAGYRRR